MTIPISGRRILVNLVIQIIPIPFWGCLSGADGYDGGVVGCQGWGGVFPGFSLFLRVS